MTSKPDQARVASHRPGICLEVPCDPDCPELKDAIAAVLAEHRIASIRIQQPAAGERDFESMAEFLLAAVGVDETEILAIDRADLAARCRLDGVHLTDGARTVPASRRLLGDERTIGAFCGSSRDAGYKAGEASADYVAFGPLDAGGGPAAGCVSPDFLELWTSTTIIPALADCCGSPEQAAAFAPVSDFLVIGPEIWNGPAPSDALRDILASVPPDSGR